MNDEKTNGRRNSHSDPSLVVDEQQNAKMTDTIPDHSKAAAAQIAAMSAAEYAEAERKLLRKLDLRLIPWMTLLYMMSFIDRVNVGTAKLTGLTTQLKLTSLQYSNASTIFFVSYVAFEVPSNLILKRFRPSRWIPFTMIIWAIFQILMGCVTTYGQLLALRFCLGLFESGLFPGLNFFLTGWYRREEINKRCSFFFAGAVLAGAFGGILGYGFSRMVGVGGKEGWSWIFIMEGILTLLVAIGSIWMVHDWPDQARFLTPLEREMVITRIRAEQGLAGEGSFGTAPVVAALKDYKTYVLMLMYMGAAVPLYSGSLFTPSIIAALGKWSTAQSLLLSTPPYALTFVTTLATAWYSDKIRRRGFFLMFWSIVAVTGYAILLGLPVKGHAGALYFAVFLTVAASGPLIGTTIAWTANTWGNHYKRAICMGLVFSAGNSGGIVASQAYRNQDAPRFQRGHGVALAFAAANGLMALLLYILLSRENARREREYGSAPKEEEVHAFESEDYKRKWGLEGMTREQIVALGDDHPAYRYML